MKLRSMRLWFAAGRFGTVLLFTVLMTGCETAPEHSLTHKLWDRATDPSCRPAPDPQLAVFASETNRDVLVVYDALSERQDRIERRAYFVFTNDARIMERKEPRYADLSLATNMTSMPIVAKTNAMTNKPWVARYPVSTDNRPGFELYRDGHSEGAHSLPVYNESTFGTASRVALTPFAVMGDTVMVGVVAAGAVTIGFIYSAAQHGWSYP